MALARFGSRRQHSRALTVDLHEVWQALSISNVRRKAQQLLRRQWLVWCIARPLRHLFAIVAQQLEPSRAAQTGLYPAKRFRRSIHLIRWGWAMFDSALAFSRYRLEVVKRWPDGEVKDKLLPAIESFLRRNSPKSEQSQQTSNSEFVEESARFNLWCR